MCQAHLRCQRQSSGQNEILLCSQSSYTGEYVDFQNMDIVVNMVNFGDLPETLGNVLKSDHHTSMEWQSYPPGWCYAGMSLEDVPPKIYPYKRSVPRCPRRRSILRMQKLAKSRMKETFTLFSLNKSQFSSDSGSDYAWNIFRVGDIGYCP